MCAALATAGLLVGTVLVAGRSAVSGRIPDVVGATVFTASVVALLAISHGNNWGWYSEQVR